MPRPSKTKRKPKASAQRPATSASSSNAPTSSANHRISLTDVGSIKVARPKKGKGKSKSKRAKLDPPEPGPAEFDDAMRCIAEHDDDTNSSEDSADTPKNVEDDDFNESEENNMPPPWGSIHFSTTGGKPIITAAFEEIALEGLEGITLEALWKRLAVCLSIPPPISRNLMEFVWNNVKRNDEILFYQLDKPRGKLRLSGDFNLGEEIYPFDPVNDVENNVIGSCSTYKARNQIHISGYRLKQAEEFGNTMVLVASQRLRTNALIDSFVDPRLLDVFEALIPVHFYMLEMIGRTRRQGIPTTGPRSLSDLSRDPKRLFYYRNQLQQLRLLTKQSFLLQKQTSYSVGGLVHLQRFYNEVKSKKQMIIEFIIKLIKQKPSCRLEYVELRRAIGKSTWEKYQLSKVIKSMDFRQFVKTDVIVPYRVMYPGANVSEWKHKARDAEKGVRVFELLNPNLNINSIFKDDKDDDGKESSDSEEDGESPNSIMSMRRVYEEICQAGAKGITLRAVSTRSNCDHHTTRNIIRNLTNLGLVDHNMQDSRRQHYILYIASEFKNADVNSVNTTVTAEDASMEVDDDVNDFIANVLQIDADFLKCNVKPEPETMETPVLNEYYTIQTLRRLKDNANLNVYFANQHPFKPVQLRPLVAPAQQIATESSKTKGFFSAMLDSPKDEASNSIAPFLPVCQYDITAANCDRTTHKLRRTTRHYTQRTLRSFRPFKCLLNTKFTTKSIDFYTDELTANAEYVLSSSDDEHVETMDSIESVMSGKPGTHAAKGALPKEVTTAIIEHFEQQESRLCDKLATESGGLLEVEMMIEEPAEDRMCVANFYNVFMDPFMGPKPRVIAISTDRHSVDTMLVLSSRPEDFTSTRALISNSLRVKSRIQLIRDTIYNHKTFIDLIKMPSIIHQTEKAEGYNARPDRKSLQRIFTTLVKDGEFIIIKIILRHRNVVRTKNLVAEPTSDVETLVLSEVDQFKNSFAMYAKRKITDQQEHNPESPAKVRRRMKCNRFIGKAYGLSPKITKMRVLHEFLFYVMREYTGTPFTREESHEVLLCHCGVDTIDTVMQEASTLYQREVSWRMFVPPLPQHKNWPSGWALISDILLRLPVSLFVKLFNITYVIPELPSILNHPVRKHLLVKNMPSHIKDALHGYRKYIFSIHEVFCYLSYMGLIQFGPQRMHEKDQVFIYLNTKGVFYDTTSSESGYHHVTPKEYRKMFYEFKSASDIEKYWGEMYFYAINTKLGNRVSVVGQSIKLEYVHGKPPLIAARKSQTVESAAKNDIGYLPGDGLGACCTDSAIWLHSPRNWHWYSRHLKSNSSNQQCITGVRKKHLEQVKQVKLSEMQQHRRGAKIKVLKRRDPGNIGRIRKSRLTQPRTLKKKVILRKVKPRKAMKKLRLRADQIDRRITEKMGKCRAIFDQEEDKLILVCMACNDYLTTFNRNRAVSSSAIRDFIHRAMPQSNKKTSLAYRRRAFKLRNLVRLEDQKDGWNIKMIADFYTEKHFSRIRNHIRRNSGRVVSDTDLNMAFLYLAQYAWKRYKLNPNSDAHTVNEALKDYLKPGLIEKFDAVSDKEDNFWKDPINDDEIQQDTIQSVIHSSLSGQGNDDQWRFQLLNVYQSFSETLVRNVVVNMRDYQFIAGRRAKSEKEGTILMSGITYNLSFNYTFKQITLFPHCIFTEAHNLFMAIFQRLEYCQSKGLGFEKFEHGHGLGIGEFQTIHKVNWEFDLPDEIITLNPIMNDFSELIKELTQRYAELMKKSQEADDGSYDPEAIKNMETTLQSYIQQQGKPPSTDPTADSRESVSGQTNSQRSPSSSPEHANSEISPTTTMDAHDTSIDTVAGTTDSGVDSQEDPDEPTSTTSLIGIENYCKADRRHKAWRISDMAFMLTKGLFPELDDDDRLEKLNEHFIVRYPTCRIRFDEHLTGDDAVVNNWHEAITKDSAEILRKALNDVLIPNRLPSETARNLEPQATALANFIYDKNTLGASSHEIKMEFPGLDVKILGHLIDIGLVIRAGVCNHSFVHHNFCHNWSIYSRTEDDKTHGGYRLRISPWIRINGTLDEKVLSKWMSIVLSHCLSYPCITFNRLCARFNVVKPVDIYYILEILQRLACLRIWTYVRADEGEDIFDDFGVVPQVPSSALDDFDDVFVEVESAAITKFGAFLNRRKTDFAYAFEEAK